MKTTKRSNRVLAFIFSLAVGGVIGFAGAHFGIEAAESLPASVIGTLAVLLIPTFFLVVAVHEAGHAWAGLRMNFDFRTYVVGPLLWDKQPNGWKFRWNKNINVAGGMVICIPQSTENLARRFSLFAAGGPVASLLLAAIGFAGFYLSRQVNEPATLFLVVSYLSLMIAVLSSAIFLITALPFHTGGFYSDGARVMRFWRGGDTARFDGLILKFVSNSMAGNRPGQLDRAELQEAFDLGNRLQAPQTLYVSYYLYQWALDNGLTEEAESHLADYVRQVEEVPVGLRGSVWLEAAFYYAVVRQDNEKADKYLDLYSPSALTPFAVEYTTRAALAKINGDLDSYKKWLAKAEAALPAMMDRGAIQIVRERIEVLKHSVSGEGERVEQLD